MNNNDKNIIRTSGDYDIKESACSAYNWDTGRCKDNNKPCDYCYSESLRIFDEE